MFRLLLVAALFLSGCVTIEQFDAKLCLSPSDTESKQERPGT